MGALRFLEALKNQMENAKKDIKNRLLVLKGTLNGKYKDCNGRFRSHS